MKLKSALIGFVVFSALFVPVIAYSQAAQLAKPFTGVVNIAVARALKQKMLAAGATAEKITATTSAASNVIQLAVVGGTVATTVAAVGTAPVWLSVAMGLGALYEIYDFTMGSKDFRVAPAQTQVVVTSGTQKIALPPPTPIPVNQPLSIPPLLPADYADPGIGVAVKYPNNFPICATTSTTTQTSTGGGTTTSTVKNICGASVADIESQAQQWMIRDHVTRWTASGYVTFSGLNQTAFTGPTKTSCTLSPLICPEGVIYANTRSFTGTVTNSSGTVQPVNALVSFSIFNNPVYTDPNRSYTLNDAASKLQDEDLNSRADPAVLAAIANKIWQQAAQQPGYQGAPYDALNPITEQNILDDIAAGRYPHPTNRDLMALPSPDLATAPQLDPNASPVVAADAAAVTVDLGANPGVVEPALEDSPTGLSIVSGVMNLLPSLSAFQVPGHLSVCSAPTFEFFNSSYSMQSMCDLLEQQRVLLSTIFGALWGIFALTIVLKA